MMERLKALREAAGVTQAEFAKRLGTTQQSYARWESGKTPTPAIALREMAFILETTTDYLLGRGPAKAPSARIRSFWHDSDRFWGHLGLRLPGSLHSKWYAVTQSEANKVRQELASGFGVSKWIIVETLNNRVVAIRTKHMQRIWLLDDANDGPGDDWMRDTDWDDRCGLSPEVYKAMNDWASDEVTEDTTFIEGHGEEVRGEALSRIEKGSFLSRPEDLLSALNDTTIHFIDGTTTSYEAYRPNLVSLASQLDGESAPDFVEISSAGGDFESFYPTKMLRMVEIPMIELQAGQCEIESLLGK